MLYFDHATASPPLPQVLKLMEENLDSYISIASPYSLGIKNKKQVIELYEKAMALLHLSEKDKIVFTSSSSESISQVVFSVWSEVSRRNGKTHFVASALSEASPVLAMSFYDSKGGKLHVTKASSQGIVSVDEIVRLLSPRTVLVSLSLVSGLTGTIQPLSEIRALCKERGVLLHVDVTHALGKIYFDLHELDADYVTLSFCPLQGPVHSGLLLTKKDTPLVPLIFGQNEEFLRGGDIDIATISGSIFALEQSLEDLILYGTEVARLRNLFETELMSAISGSHVLFHDGERAPHISCMAFPKVKSEALLFLLQKRGLYATMGGGSFQTLSVALTACGFDKATSDSALSFSLSKTTTEEEVKKAVALIATAVNELRRLSRGFI